MQQAFTCLVLGRSRNVHVSREVREELRYFLFCHFSGVTFAMEKNEGLNPIDVSLLGATAVLLTRMTLRTWSSNLGLFSAGLLATVPCMTPILSSSTPNSSRIRPKNRAFLLKDLFFGPNSR